MDSKTRPEQNTQASEMSEPSLVDKAYQAIKQKSHSKRSKANLQEFEKQPKTQEYLENILQALEHRFNKQSPNNLDQEYILPNIIKQPSTYTQIQTIRRAEEMTKGSETFRQMLRQNDIAEYCTELTQALGILPYYTKNPTHNRAIRHVIKRPSLYTKKLYDKIIETYKFIEILSREGAKTFEQILNKLPKKTTTAQVMRYCNRLQAELKLNIDRYDIAG